MSESEKRETDEKKLAESKQGKQFVDNTPKAKESRQKAQEERKAQSEGDESGEEAKDDDAPRRSTRKRSSPSGGKQAEQKQAGSKQGAQKQGGKKQAPKEKEEDDEEQEDSEKETKSKKQKTSNSGGGGKSAQGSSKTYGSKHDKATPPEGTKQATASNLPKKGDKVHSKAMPGWCHGKVTEIVTSDKTIDGKGVKATKDKPKIAIRSDGPSGKIAVHNVDKVYIAAK